MHYSRRVSSHCRPFLFVALLVNIAAPAVALAQPGMHTPAHHAEPPLPQALPSPMPSLPPPVARAPGEMLLPPWFGSWVIERPGYTASIGADGTLDFGERLISGTDFVDPVQGIGPRFTFDATDIVMRWIGEDPYSYDKLKILDSTRARREQIKRMHDEDIMERALVDLPAYLEAIWRTRKWSETTRRQILFELWDEAAEDGNELVSYGGNAARNIIARYIARRLARGSRHGFTRRELVVLNARRTSRARFAPYAPADRVLPGPLPAATEPLIAAADIHRVLAAF